MAPDAESGASMTMIGHGQGHRVDVPATGGAYRTVATAVPIPAGAAVIVQRNTKDQARDPTIDGLRGSG